MALQNLRDLEELIGKDTVDFIINEVACGRLLKTDGVKFADFLHPEAAGAFLISEKPYSPDAMELMLSSWFEKGEVFNLTKEDALGQLILALEKARKKVIASKIRKMHHIGTQDITQAMSPHLPRTPTKTAEIQTSRFEKMKGPSGGHVEKAINCILEAVRVGNITRRDALEFAEGLHPKVRGLFIHAEHKEFGERAMRDIFSDFFDVAGYKLSKEDKFDAILKALKGIDKPPIVYEIEQACTVNI